jgi:hypothetical protein
MNQSNDDTDGLGSEFPPKPKRPLNIFSLFSKLERNYLVQKSQRQPSSTIGSNESETKGSEVDAVDPYLEMRPEKYRDVVLPANWFKVGDNKNKREDHKRHGVISFRGLTTTLSNGWNEVDEETRRFCEMIYADELTLYRQEMAEYEKMYGKQALKAQKRTYKKRNKDDDPKEHFASGSDTHHTAASSQNIQLHTAAPGINQIIVPQVYNDRGSGLPSQGMALNSNFALLSYLTQSAAPSPGTITQMMVPQVYNAMTINSNDAQRAAAGAQLIVPQVHNDGCSGLPSQGTVMNLNDVLASHSQNNYAAASRFSSQALGYPCDNFANSTFVEGCSQLGRLQNPQTFPSPSESNGIVPPQTNALSFAGSSQFKPPHNPTTHGQHGGISSVVGGQFTYGLTGLGPNMHSCVGAPTGSSSIASSKENSVDSSFHQLQCNSQGNSATSEFTTGFQLGQLENRFQAGMEPTPYHLAQHHQSHPEHNQRTVQFMQPVRTATSVVDISTPGKPQADHLLLEEQPVTAEPEQRGNVGDLSTYLGYENLLTDYLPAYDRCDALGSVGNNNIDNILSGEELEKAFDSESSEEQF